MSIKRNILANYASQIYVTVISIVMVPVCVRYMGVEAYGLVGFFAMLQAWFQLLDMGLTPTMARETARFNGGATDAISLRRLLRAMEGIFIGVALLGAMAMLAGSGLIASRWLKVEQLPLGEVQNAIMLMAGAIALRWVSGLYRGVVSGFEKQVWLSGFNIAMVTARFVLVIPYFIYVGTSPTEFFSYQLALAVIEVVALVFHTYQLMPRVISTEVTPWQWVPLRNVLKFSVSIAFTTLIWILITQTDKLILSNLLPLSEYAYFTQAILLAGGVSVVSGPISTALIPRMSKLVAEGDDANLIRLYRNATQLVAVIAMPVILCLALFSEQILWMWSGNRELSNHTGTVLSLYAIGNGILVFSAFPFYLQNAKGNLKFHLIGNALFFIFLVPSLIWASINHGAIGAGWVWLISNLAYFLVWIPLVHKRFLQGIHIKWVTEDIGLMVVPTLVLALLLKEYLIWTEDRFLSIFTIGLIAMILIFTSAIGSAYLRCFIKRFLIKKSK